MFDWLDRSFDQYSVLWLVLSSFLGALLREPVAYLFGELLPTKMRRRQEILTIQAKYQTPILYAAAALRDRLGNLIRHIDLVGRDNWLRHDPPGYYYLSTLYVVGSYLGWLQVMRREVIYLDLASTSKTRRFEQFLEAVEKGFSDPSLFAAVQTGDPARSRDQWVFSLQLRAIGDLMIEEQQSGQTVIGYGRFRARYLGDDDAAFRAWHDVVGRLFQSISRDDLRFRRIITIHAMLNAFLDYLDPKHLRVKAQPDYLGYLRKEEAAAIEDLLTVSPNRSA